MAMSDERQGTAYDPHAVGHEKVGRGLPPPDINKIIKTAVYQACSCSAGMCDADFDAAGVAVVKALGDEGYVVMPKRIAVLIAAAAEMIAATKVS
jgi:hypothetical protein